LSPDLTKRASYSPGSELYLRLSFQPRVLVNADFPSPLTSAIASSRSADPRDLRVTVRPVRFDDLPSVATVLADSFHPPHHWRALIYPFLRLGIQEDLRTRLLTSSTHYLCLAAIASSGRGGRGERVVGTVEMALSAPRTGLARAYQSTYLSNLAVMPGCRRQGIARQLLRRCEQTTRDWGLDEIYLHVLENNHAARGLYTRCGFHLRRTDGECGAWLFRQPRRLLLGKCLRALAG